MLDETGWKSVEAEADMSSFSCTGHFADNSSSFSPSIEGLYIQEWNHAKERKRKFS